ncbi:glycoside hydrolase family 18 protein [Caproiciproducens faecalis]|uniref:chitinase n=1 Tax=Caproiciproducens faecalis TaxID=2820301 RepID=A0ABS7DL62_9FIRM|nr:glycoside hydrolase family 18 protein [Caproiciproducens faecalis]MBW7572017.1 glycoside hydrolase family 18 protein [Caproiciproducens faecalis]
MKKNFFLKKFLYAAIVLVLIGAAAGMSGSNQVAVNSEISSSPGSAAEILNGTPVSSESPEFSSAEPGSSSVGSISSAGVSSGVSRVPGQSQSNGTGSIAAASPSASPPFQHSSKMVLGYYGGWAAYSGFSPDKISASSLDVLNYAFAKIDTNLKVTAADSSIDYSNFTKLKNLKRTYSKLKTIISIGGWSDSGRFSDAALTETSRTAFADSAVSFMKKNGFDGIDIDWEYPTGGGLSSNVTRSADPANFRLLLKTLRSKLDSQGARDNRHYILSFAGGTSSSYAKKIGLSTVAQYVDYGMIMTYDFHGSWEAYTDFNAPLYPCAGQSPLEKSSVDAAVQSWLNHGFPAGKLIMGVPFYGYVYQGTGSANNGLWQSFSSASPVGYDTVQSKYLSKSSFRRYRDSSAQVPWLFDGSTFVSFEDTVSIQKKVQYSASKKLLGVGVWDLGFDKTGTLIKSVKQTLK